MSQVGDVLGGRCPMCEMAYVGDVPHGIYWLISLWTKWPQFHRRYFQLHFREWKVLYFDLNFTDVWQYPSIVLDNGLATNRRQANIWTNADPVHWHICSTKRRWIKKNGIVCPPFDSVGEKQFFYPALNGQPWNITQNLAKYFYHNIFRSMHCCFFDIVIRGRFMCDKLFLIALADPNAISRSKWPLERTHITTIWYNQRSFLQQHKCPP